MSLCPMVNTTIGSAYIVCFESQAKQHDQEPQQSGWRQAVLPLRSKVSHFISATRMGKALTLYFVVLLLEIFIFAVAIFRVSGWYRMTLFMLFLGLQSLLVLNALREVDKCTSPNEVRHLQWQIRGKLGLMACGAWLPACWWFFESVSELSGRKVGGYGGHRLPVDRDACMLAMGMFLLHFGMAALVLNLAWHAGRKLVQNVLKPLKLYPTKFGDCVQKQRDNSTGCVICLEEFDTDSIILELPCQHVFHAECLALWLCRAEHCPLRCNCAVLELPPHAPQFVPSGQSISEVEAVPANSPSLPQHSPSGSPLETHPTTDHSAGTSGLSSLALEQPAVELGSQEALPVSEVPSIASATPGVELMPKDPAERLDDLAPTRVVSNTMSSELHPEARPHNVEASVAERTADVLVKPTVFGATDADIIESF